MVQRVPVQPLLWDLTSRWLSGACPPHNTPPAPAPTNNNNYNPDSQAPWRPDSPLPSCTPDRRTACEFDSEEDESVSSWQALGFKMTLVVRKVESRKTRDVAIALQPHPHAGALISCVLL